MKNFWLLFLTLPLVFACNMGNDPSINPGSSNSSGAKGKAQIIKYDIISGQKYFDSKVVEFRIDYESNEFTILLTANIADSIERISERSGMESMNCLLTTINASTKTNKNFATKSDIHYIGESKITHQAKFTLADFHMLSAGSNAIRLDFNCEVIGHDEGGDRADIKSGIETFKASVLFHFNIPPIHKSTIHFKALKLNKEETDAFLKKRGSNDFINSTPEAGIKIFYRGNLLFKGFTKNSYEYKEKKSVDFYHISNSDAIKFKAIDADYGVNIDDYVSHIDLTVEKLLGSDHENRPFERVDEFWVYCTTEGRVN